MRPNSCPPLLLTVCPTAQQVSAPLLEQPLLRGGGEQICLGDKESVLPKNSKRILMHLIQMF